MKTLLKTLPIIAGLSASISAMASQCHDEISLQVLGSGGPELNDNRSSASYLIWYRGKASVIVDTGAGSSVNFGAAKASFADLDAILLSHLHVDHSSDLSAYIKGSFFTPRSKNLKLFGSTGNKFMPSLGQFVNSLFGQQGAYPYLANYFKATNRGYHVEVIEAETSHKDFQYFTIKPDIKLTGVSVHHGPLPAMAWRVNIDNCSVTFSGDMSNNRKTLSKLARNTDILVAHNAVPESAKGIAANLHMLPSEIGDIAEQAKVKHLVISHRMNRTIGKEQETLEKIRQHYQGKVSFADDLSKYLLNSL
ncbi:MBL fold metallo-hydrolase [Endozoicomonas sp. G2_1]|uniref:MBL fold metallo-hydrolase n=1 Tax=Endozoicomonas sp. G2_1 TaxID=2821091 RepID=UPI001ADCCA67|nr:MBL fold metallo-hydrolase [Endozoicomonas sp. G2_1]MBO9489499.1 MBL fold metallo-hydrolase [Endozoicomonas sp. G2_1]